MTDAWAALGTEHSLYERTPLARRLPLRWPDGQPLAFAVVVSVEYYELRQAPSAFVPPNLPGLFGRGPYPDFGNFSRREYGNRVGIFRVMEALDRFGLRATVALDAHVARHYPVIPRECLRRDWEIAGHGCCVNRVISEHMSETEEQRYVADALSGVEAATGIRPRGWHGPEYGESRRTPALLASLGVHYVLDWPNDEQPYFMDTESGALVSIPMAIDLDDVHAHWHRRVTMARWRTAVVEAADRLASDGLDSARVLVLNLHPWLMGHPFRIGYLEEVLAAITERKDVWATTVGEIATAYAAQARPAEPRKVLAATTKRSAN